jgi:hypothetical protein
VLRVVLLIVNLCLCVMVLSLGQMNATDQAIFVELFLGGLVVLLTDCKTLQGVGMWTALRARTQQRAVLGTLGSVMLVPWAAIFLVVFLGITGAFRPSSDGISMVFALWFLAGILNDLYFGSKARLGLSRGLRYWVSEGKEAGGRERFLAAAPPAILPHSA